MDAEPSQCLPGIDRIVPVRPALTAATQETANDLIFGESDVRGIVAIGHEGQRAGDPAVDQAGFNHTSLVDPVGHLAGIQVIDGGPTGSGV
jgi:hypothetical protein